MVRERSMPEGSKLSFEWLPVGQLQVDHSYGRELQEVKVKKLMKTFDPDAIGALLVSRRDDDTTWTLDGQHRAVTVERLWGGAEKVPCLVYHGLTVADEARIYLEYNDGRTKPRPIELFKARLAAHEPVALDIQKAVRASGLKIAQSGGDTPKVINAVSTLDRVYKGAGAAVLTETIDLLARAGLADETALNAQMIGAVGILLARYGHVLDRKRLLVVLEKSIPRQIQARARAMRAEFALTKGSLSDGMAQLLIVKYNQRLSQSKKVRWAFDQSDRDYWVPVDNTSAE